mmetsp:Transcript_168459/g.541347  ORF Transcript_168459/g.541347 Transcript_168459/m.541347 type:complete len:205 (-) Transcript_168459:401-1015(-)
MEALKIQLPVNLFSPPALLRIVVLGFFVRLMYELDPSDGRSHGEDDSDHGLEIAERQILGHREADVRPAARPIDQRFPPMRESTIAHIRYRLVVSVWWPQRLQRLEAATSLRKHCEELQSRPSAGGASCPWLVGNDVVGKGKLVGKAVEALGFADGNREDQGAALSVASVRHVLRRAHQLHVFLHDTAPSRSPLGPHGTRLQPA